MDASTAVAEVLREAAWQRTRHGRGHDSMLIAQRLSLYLTAIDKAGGGSRHRSQVIRRTRTGDNSPAQPHDGMIDEVEEVKAYKRAKYGREASKDCKIYECPQSTPNGKLQL